jgi:hypothetical protein
VPLACFTSEHCYPDDYRQSINGKVIAISQLSLRGEYQTADKQLCLVTGGFGAEANSRGRAVYVINLYHGKETRWNREDVLGEVKLECLPDWAKERLAVIQAEREKPKKSKETER